jgi:signal transduction histidine kinase/CheY-like chemotaxis protein
LGVGLAVLYYILSSSSFDIIINFNVISYSIVVFFSLVAGLVFNYANRMTALYKQKAQHQQLTSIAGSIVHEIRNPLNTINLAANQLRHIAPKIDNQEIKNNIDDLDSIISASIAQANNTIDIVLADLSEKVVNPASFISLSAKKIIETTVATFSYSSQEEKAKVKITINQENDFIFKATQDRLTFIFYNLLKNGLYYLKDYPKSVITIGVQTSNFINNQTTINQTDSKNSQSPTTNNNIIGSINSPNIDYNKYSVIYVHDTGPGINPKIMPKLFGSFFTSGKKGGTGLGLSFCRRNMKIFGGDIVVESQFEGVINNNLESQSVDENLQNNPNSQLDNNPNNQAQSGNATLNPNSQLLNPTKDTTQNWTRFYLLFPKLSEQERIKATAEIKQKELQEQERKKLKKSENTIFAEDKKRQIGNQIFNHSQSLASLGTTPEVINILKGKKALVADDSDVSLMMIKNFLTSNGLVVTTAQNGKELFTKYQQSLDHHHKSSFDIIITDINMGGSKTKSEDINNLLNSLNIGNKNHSKTSHSQPNFKSENQNLNSQNLNSQNLNSQNLNGDYATLLIRQLEKQQQHNNQNQNSPIPIIALSGDGQEQDLKHFYHCQINDYFVKGSNPELILRVVARGILGG